MSTVAMEAVPQSISDHVADLCTRARLASRLAMGMDDASKQRALLSSAQALERCEAEVLAANALDLAAARGDGLSAAMIDRLRLDHQRYAAVVSDLRAVASLPDPVGRVLERFTITQGIPAEKIAVPIGVVAIIFESRPNVTIDAAALCLRSGNACILRGGKEAIHTNRALAQAFRQGLREAGAEGDLVQLVQEQDRRLIAVLLSRDDAIDVVVPRGGEALIRMVVACSKVPVIRHDKGVCSLYVHADADIEMALALVIDGKCSKPGVCNAIENLLVDQHIAPRFLPRLSQEMHARQVELRADPEALAYLPHGLPASEEDWSCEYLALILAVKTVTGLDQAIAFTNRYGSQHSDGIITANTQAAERYLREVDAACVYHNASTRFTDGGQFGFGAEVGISTNRLHARGPMGLAELCTYKYVLRGQGQVRS
jgi:glutamate-5-semialdehyde dehydrogenase